MMRTYEEMLRWLSRYAEECSALAANASCAQETAEKAACELAAAAAAIGYAYDTTADAVLADVVATRSR